MTAKLRLVVDDVAFGESPRWHEGRLWFCDWIDGDVISVKPDGSDRTVHAHVDGFPICIDWDHADRLMVVDGSGRRVLRIDHGQTQPLVDLSSVSDKPWNEIAAHPSGWTYVNGIGFDMMAGDAPSTGQIALVEPDGSVRQVADGLSFPNGMAIADEGATLLVAESHAGRITAFSIGDDGSLGEVRVFAEITGSAPDGICLAEDGSLWYADVPNQHCQRVAEGGEVLETIIVDRGCFSCALAPDGSLYATATVWDADTFSTRRGVVYELRAGTV